MSSSVDEFLKKEIEKRLKRTPNELENHLFEALWSEHCGYLHSKKQLKKLNFKGSFLPDENSGGVKIGNHGVFFKVESHNHPCAVEPYQGAATGIGGIIRDILALNARPVALLNSLKLAYPDTKEARHIINGVTKGISDYGNSCGIADIAGEVIFDECYKDLPLVNVMAAGVAALDKVKLSAFKENLEVVLLGSATGLDGVGGAAFASKKLAKNKNEEKIHVQIGDPFIKKLLIEATLEILDLDGVVSCQDCGAAGLLSSTSEMAYKGNCSFELELDKVHLAQKNIEPWQIMLSETQERMVFALKKEALPEVFKIAQKYELEASCIGRTFEGGDYVIKKDSKILSSTPLDVLCNPYCYDLEPVFEPDEIKNLKDKKCELSMDIESAVEKMTSLYNLVSRKWFYEQWDYLVGGRSCVAPESTGVGVLKFEEENCFVAFCMDTNPLMCALDPYLGSQNTLLESYRNLVSSGFEPLGFTNCLNFASPKGDDTKYSFVKSIEGLRDCSLMLNTPVVSGNVSFYNEAKDKKIYPSVTVGMCGFLDINKPVIKSNFALQDEIYLIGKMINKNSNIGGSLYQRELFDFMGGSVDEPDFELENILKKTIFSLRDKKILKSAVDVSKGGVLGTLFRVLCASNTGFVGKLINEENVDDKLKLKLLFGEIQTRYIISSQNKKELESYFAENNIPYLYLGKCIGDKIKFDGYEFELAKFREKYLNTLQNALED